MSEAPATSEPQPGATPAMDHQSAAALREAVRQLHRYLGRIVAPGGIDETRFVTLGGFAQHVALRGQSGQAPILLFLHGGPGSPVSEFAYAYQRPWEDFFLVVNWDQRGFGRSWGRPEDAGALKGTLNKPRFIADAIELIEWLCGEFGRERIVLVGQSWGTVMALEIARARPDLLHVAVVRGLAANWLGSADMLVGELIAAARRAGNTAEAERLTALGPVPPGEDGAAVVRWARDLGVGIPDPHTWHNILGEGDGWLRRIDMLRFISPDFPAEAYEAERARAREMPQEGQSRYAEAMSSVAPWDAARDVGHHFEVPIVVQHGAHDWQTWTPLARAYYEAIEAPWKKWVEFPHAAHALSIEQPGLAVVSLVNDALPATRGELPPGAERAKHPGAPHGPIVKGDADDQ